MRKSLLSLAIAAGVLSGCSLIPDYERPEAPVAAAYPQGEAYDAAKPANAGADIGWREFFKDPQLQLLVEVSLENNRDLRVAALNIEAYRAQYRIQRADLFPAVDANASGSRQHVPGDLSQTGHSTITSQYGATLGVTAWEVDLFGRLRALRDQALETYFASEQARRSTQTSLVANVANAYLTLRADQAQLELARNTLATYQKSYDLTKRSHEVGAASALDLAQAQTSVERARAISTQYTRLVAQDQNALVLLLGSGLPADLPKGGDLSDDLLATVPAGLPSDLLQRRPDIIQAEHQLKAANANIGAARAAFFPRISLTANAGSLSPDLSGLFDGGSGSWLFQPSISLPIFNAGALQASLDLAKVQKDINVAQYEKAIQTAFSEVADGLAARGTFGEQLQAQRALVDASDRYYRLADHRYRTGVDNYLTLLDAQRSLYSAQQQLISDRLNQLTSEVNLYKALGGGWSESAAQAKPISNEAPQG
ncbi:AdeC/AdeK/OprM family multidrug efflux complex outer membrane factor [Pseudomonas sp. LA21]|uniref:AdeC/AdeK/OprM family multidrug efflux complex outer membrane factor n=1 Tax=unclassified Pseudomonas TaxID=196821 RepID=UPI001FB6F16A|nr:AdeC/AdeK/OprM family multidrug efflux complex outer membrane factor [Pseudomonas sp. LA21]MCJ1886827.1 AdeC/AdeK/OprM family multidrug efflux complex outer membrane factor [Pseudomonas sp. LA21]